MKKFCVKGLGGSFFGQQKMMFELFSPQLAVGSPLFLQRLTEPFVR